MSRDAERFRDLAKLRRAVRATCKRWFASTFAIEWREHVLPDHHVEVETRKRFEAFRAAYIELRTFVKRADGAGGDCASFVVEELAPTLDTFTPVARPPRWRELHGRLYLTALVEALEGMIKRTLVPKERAMLSLLLGAWPERFDEAAVKRFAPLVSEVIDAERRNISQALRRQNPRTKRPK